MPHFWLSSVNQKRCCLSSPVTRRTNGLFINMRWASPVSWVSLAHALFPWNIFVVFTACRWSIRHFEVARKTGSRRLLKCIVGLFWGTHFQHGGKFVPQNNPTMHFDNHLDPVSRATSANKVANKSRLSQFATLKTRKKLGRGSFRKDFWDRYRGRAIQLLANLFALSP